ALIASHACTVVMFHQASRRSSCCSLLFAPSSPTSIYTLSLHDALPISLFLEDMQIYTAWNADIAALDARGFSGFHMVRSDIVARSEEHTSELQSRENLVCRLLLEKKKKKESLQPYHRIKPIRSSGHQAG